MGIFNILLINAIGVYLHSNIEFSSVAAAADFYVIFNCKGYIGTLIEQRRYLKLLIVSLILLVTMGAVSIPFGFIPFLPIVNAIAQAIFIGAIVKNLVSPTKDDDAN